MDAVEAAVMEAWVRVYPRLLEDPAEMRKRLARRKGVLLRVPVETCVAVRAGDARWGAVGREVSGARLSEDVPEGEEGVIAWAVPAGVRARRRVVAEERERMAELERRLAEWVEPEATRSSALSDWEREEQAGLVEAVNPWAALGRRAKSEAERGNDAPKSKGGRVQPGEGGAAERERVVISGRMLRELCALVRISGEGKPRAARKLGVSVGTLMDVLARQRGRVGATFREIDQRGETGVMPHQKELVAKLRLMGETDLNGEAAKFLARGRRRPGVKGAGAVRVDGRFVGEKGDPAWACVREGIEERIEEAFVQEVVRERCVQRAGGDVLRADGGTDLRTAAADLPWDGGAREGMVEADGGTSRGAARRRRTAQWMWVCPGCSRRVRRVFLPVRKMVLPEFLGLETKRGEGEALVPAVHWLGCGACHRVDPRRSWDGDEGWNVLVSYLSGGLLYGREVERPGEWKEWRAATRAWVGEGTGKAGRRRIFPAPRTEELLRRIRAGETYAMIATAMGVKVESVYVRACVARKAGVLEASTYRERGRTVLRDGSGDGRVVSGEGTAGPLGAIGRVSSPR